jgi:Tol biopolymer transport system component
MSLGRCAATKHLVVVQGQHPGETTHIVLHPGWKRVYFASDRDVEPALYLADLPGAF